jgi:hypothetical protein
MDKYSCEEFAECYSLRGYGRKKDALAWLGDREEACEEDFERCYHDTKRPEYRRAAHGLAADGQNMDSAAHMGNSRGETFAAMMRREITINDAFERGYRKKMQMQEGGEAG